jgi:hypothetical protein
MFRMTALWGVPTSFTYLIFLEVGIWAIADTAFGLG